MDSERGNKMKRKTVDIIALIDKVNELNSKSTVSKDMRTGWNELLEFILMEANVYGGYKYLDVNRVPHGEKPGIAFGGTPKDNAYPDESRRFYFKVNSLQ